jgi:hypothetical protein
VTAQKDRKIDRYKDNSHPHQCKHIRVISSTNANTNTIYNMTPFFEPPLEPKRLLASWVATSLGETYQAKYKMSENKSIEGYELKA